jgi:hypothetical protein
MPENKAMPIFSVADSVDPLTLYPQNNKEKIPKNSKTKQVFLKYIFTILLCVLLCLYLQIPVVW